VGKRESFIWNNADHYKMGKFVDSDGKYYTINTSGALENGKLIGKWINGFDLLSI